jgi:sugar phosphate isomerase/epimerase
MANLLYGLQVYSIRKDAENDFRGTMEKVKAMGYDGVETAGTYNHTLPELREILDEIGLTWVSAHVGYKELQQDEILDGYKAVGVNTVVIPWMKIEPTREEVDNYLEIIRSIGERCKARNMTLLYHNHDFEFNKVDGEYILDIFYSEIGADLLQTELDTCWVNVGGENPSEYMLKYTGRSPIVHLKDFIGQKTDNMYALIGNNTAKEGDIQEFQYRPVGYGRQDIPSILASAEKVGAKWAIVEQDKATMEKTPLECAEMSIKYLKSLEA